MKLQLEAEGRNEPLVKMQGCNKKASVDASNEKRLRIDQINVVQLQLQGMQSLQMMQTRVYK